MAALRQPQRHIHDVPHHGLPSVTRCRPQLRRERRNVFGQKAPAWQFLNKFKSRHARL